MPILKLERLRVAIITVITVVMSGYRGPTCSSSTSKSNEEVVVQSSRIAEGQQYLGWSIESEREKGLSNKAQNVWSRYSEMVEEYFEHKLSTLLASINNGNINASLSSTLHNLLKDFKKSPLVLTREVMEGEDKGKSVVVVGAGVLFLGQGGVASHARTVKCIKSTTLLWLAKFVRVKVLPLSAPYGGKLKKWEENALEMRMRRILLVERI